MNWPLDDATLDDIERLVRGVSPTRDNVWLDQPLDDGWTLPDEEPPHWPDLEDDEPIVLHEFAVRDETGNGGTFQMTDVDAQRLAKRPGWTVTLLDGRTGSVPAETDFGDEQP